MTKLSQYQSQVTLYLSTLFRYGKAKFKLVRTCKTCAENVWTFDS